MKVETAQLAIQFLQRVQLNVAEMPAMQQVLAELTEVAQSELHVVDGEAIKEQAG